MLGPMLFNIFINDLFFLVKKAKLNAHVDDHQVYYSHVDLAALEAWICHDVGGREGGGGGGVGGESEVP